MNNNKKITILGLGYVGLPLAVEFAKKYMVIGFDINEKRINELGQELKAEREHCDNRLNQIIQRNEERSQNLLSKINELTKQVADLSAELNFLKKQQ